MQNPPELRQATEPNLYRTLADLGVQSETTMIITDRELPLPLEVTVIFG